MGWNGNLGVGILITIPGVISRLWILRGKQSVLAMGLLSLLLMGCAVKPRFSVGEALLRGETPPLLLRVDSMRAEMELTAYGGGKKSSVSAVFSCRPRARYKLDLFGLPGMVAASFLWVENSWTLVMFDRETFAADTGEHVEFGNLGIREVSVHDVFAFLWGDFFPGFSGRGVGGLSGDGLGLTRDFQLKAGGLVSYAARGQRWTASLEEKNGLVVGVVREDSAFRIEYGDYKVMRGRPVPRRTRLYSRAGLLLEIRVKDVEDNPHWRRDPFYVKVPAGFQKLDRAVPEDP